ncbi:hypothetical protein N7495_003956 [Penicillium taxi]|uniref:uncharacterized protein n=1 Tax=Penicillium taxi TaxID=168475 RepID=UPI002544EE40|nr:uncharacterized protein N7495_003956 [Penicillium taxi]KAJ5899212.1 hypothetical protein N7495_003956 [Penicillium taxi]
MNNEDFRRLIFDSSSQSGDKPKRNEGTPTALGSSRSRSSYTPMTPRSTSTINFSQQLAQQREANRPTKRFKSAAVPKGTKLAAGYQDRAQLRNTEGEQKDDIQKRIQALEEMVKLGQIDQPTFEKLRAELGVGGDTSSTHLVKGMDWELLRRVKAGEDVSKAAHKPAPESTVDEVAEDPDEAFERLMDEKAQEEIQALPKEQREKKGHMAPPPPPKKTREQILSELRARYVEPTTAPAPQRELTLGSKFKKIGSYQPEKKRFIESDKTGRRREVLLITDSDGKTKRKVRWLDPVVDPSESKSALLTPDLNTKPLNTEVPTKSAALEAANVLQDDDLNNNDDDDDIFADAGTTYNPLAGLGQEEDSSSDEEDKEAGTAAKKQKTPLTTKKQDKAPATDDPREVIKPRNYFDTGDSSTAEEPEKHYNPLNDPVILAAFKRAAALEKIPPSEEDSISAESSLRHKKFLEEAKRQEALDNADMDYGFGGSRVEDGEDDDQRLLDFDDNGPKKRKRGPKKKKGDKNSAADVLGVLDRRAKSSA